MNLELARTVGCVLRREGLVRGRWVWRGCACAFVLVPETLMSAYLTAVRCVVIAAARRLRGALRCLLARYGRGAPICLLALLSLS